MVFLTQLQIFVGWIPYCTTPDSSEWMLSV